jgi:uncharacterized Zn finger protein
MSPIAPQVDCPSCGSVRVVQVTPIEFGVLECQECGERWNEESMPENAHDRAPKVRKVRVANG